MAISFAISSSMCFNIFGWFWVQSPLAKRHLDSTHSSAAQKQDQTLLTKEYQHLKFHLVLALQGSLVGTSAEGKDIFFKALINVPAFFFHSPMPCLFDSVWFVHEGKGTWGGQMYLSTNVTCSTWQDTLLIPGVALFFFFFFLSYSWKFATGKMNRNNPWHFASHQWVTAGRTGMEPCAPVPQRGL